MSQTIEQLQAEWDTIKAEVDAMQAEYDTLCRKRSSFHLTLIFPQDRSSEAQTEFHQKCQAEVKVWSVDLKELEQQIKATRLKLKKIQSKLAVKHAKIYQVQAQQRWPQLCQQAEKVNQLATQLENEVQTFWQIAHDFKPRLGNWLPEAPQLSKFPSPATIPTVKRLEYGLELVNQSVDFQENESSNSDP